MRRPTPPAQPAPHPLSALCEEFVWAGKYDASGRRRSPDLPPHPPRPVPVEAWATPAGANPGAAPPLASANLLLAGDNRLALAALLPEYRKRVQLIYIDPPFDTGTDHTLRMPIGAGSAQADGNPHHLDVVAYRDTWGGVGGSYLQMMYERLVLMHELLRDTGVLCLHCDWRTSARLRLVLDEVFGPERFVNEIVWHYYNKYSAGARRLPRAHDTILVYARGPRPAIQPLRLPREVPVRQLVRENVNGVLRNARDADGRLRYRTVFDRKGDDVWRIPQLQPASREWTGHPTQKHHALLERIIAMGSREGDLVADFFCGAGTTLAVAERMGRRWIGCDQGALALHVTRKRLLRARAASPATPPATPPATIAAAPPFMIASLAAAARAEWLRREFGGKAADLRRHLLAAFGAEAAAPHPEGALHGWLPEDGGPAPCAIPTLDAPCTAEQAIAVGEAARVAVRPNGAGRGRLYLLAWDYAPDFWAGVDAWNRGMDLDPARGAAPATAQATALEIVPLLIPQALVTPAGSAPPVFRSLPRVTGAWLPDTGLPETQSQNKGQAGRVLLERYRPGPSRPAWSDHWEQPPQEADPLALLEGWTVDPGWRPEAPFRHLWWTFRTPRARALEARSAVLALPPPGDAARVVVLTMDVWGLATLHALENGGGPPRTEGLPAQRRAAPGVLPSVSELR